MVLFCVFFVTGQVNLLNETNSVFTKKYSTKQPNAIPQRDTGDLLQKVYVTLTELAVCELRGFICSFEVPAQQ